MTTANPKRRWYQYSLRMLFIVVTLICVALGLFVGPKVRRHNIVLAIEAAGGDVYYADRSDDDSWLSKRLREHVPQDWCDEITLVNLDGTDAGDATLDGLETLSGLRHLYLYGTLVTDAGLVHLEGLTCLEVLRLDGTHVTDGGLSHLKGLTGLLVLAFYRTEVTDAGRAELQKSLPNCSIR